MRLNRNALVDGSDGSRAKHFIEKSMLNLRGRFASISDGRNELIIPYAYVYLVSFLVTSYLFLFAWLQGSYFTEGANVFWELIIPFLTFIVVTVSCMCLIYIAGMSKDCRSLAHVYLT